MHTSNPNLEAIRRASDQLAGVAVETPLLRNPILDERVNANILIKPECLQRVGAFKFRGAYNRLTLLDDKEKQHGVVVHSSGNHAQGVAYASKLLGIPATIEMSSNSPQIKLERTRAYGAVVKLYDRETESREEIAQQLIEGTHAVLIKPFDDPEIIVDQGTHTISFACQHLKLVVEPGGAVALAAVLYNKIDLQGKTVGIILSGGNIDPQFFSECLLQWPNP